MAASKTISRILGLILLFSVVVALQYAYDIAKQTRPQLVAAAFSPEAARMLDLGFHSAAASFAWIGTMPEILGLSDANTQYLSDLKYVVGVDPKLSYPYAFSTLTIPAISQYHARVKTAIEIGQAGFAAADPDWRIPFYLATTYFLELKDRKNAAFYFDAVARIPDAPDYAKRFSVNFGIFTKDREAVKQLWIAIYNTTNDEFTKERAKAYVLRLNIFDALEAAAAVYKKTYGVYPQTPNDLVVRGVISKAPQDPFGFAFKFQSDGTVAIDQSKPPSWISGGLPQ